MDVAEFKTLLNSNATDIKNWLGTVKKEGINVQDAISLTLAMNSLSQQIEWGDKIVPRVDLPSTGGVGNITPIVVSLLVAATGKVFVPKISTRSLTHTGGTIDILESIGYNADISMEEMIKKVSKSKISIVVHKKEFTPIDSLLVRLRKETGTISTPELIASSIMNNKWVFNLNTVLLDCKVGKSGGVKNELDAKKLARVFVKLGETLDINVAVALTYNEFPQSMCVGNKLALYEIIQILEGKGEKHIQNLCIDLSANLLLLTGLFKELEDARNEIENVISSGMALLKFKELLENHGVKNPDFIDIPESLLSEISWEIKADHEGYVTAIDGKKINKILRQIIFTNNKLSDYDAGVMFFKRPGDKVESGEPILKVFINLNNPLNTHIEKFVDELKGALLITDEPAQIPEKFLMDIITKEKVV